jgi:hypothetical protein
MLRTQKPFARTCLFCLCGLIVICTAVGCQRGPKLPPMAKVSGTVTFDGKPVTGGMIVFVPDTSKGPDGSLGIGGLDQNGHFTIRTLKVEGGIVGWHRVRLEDPLAGGTPRVAGGGQLPATYAGADTSGLTAEVKAGQDNVIDFKLTTKR